MLWKDSLKEFATDLAGAKYKNVSIYDLPVFWALISAYDVKSFVFVTDLLLFLVVVFLTHLQPLEVINQVLRDTWSVYLSCLLLARTCCCITLDGKGDEALLLSFGAHHAFIRWFSHKLSRMLVLVSDSRLFCINVGKSELTLKWVYSLFATAHAKLLMTLVLILPGTRLIKLLPFSLH